MTEPLTPAAAAQPASTADRAALLGPGSERAAKVRAEVQRILLAEGMSQAKLAAEAGVPKGSISPWLGAKWPIGENGANSKAGEHVQLALEKWLATRERSAAVVTAAPKPPEFLETRTAQRIMQDMTFAQTMPGMVCIGGPSGIGKTTAIRAYQRSASNVWVATLNPTAGGLYGVLGAITRAVGVSEKSPLNKHDAVVDAIRAKRGLLVIDEAQHATTQALDEVRSLYDAAETGIALVGNEAISGNVYWDKRRKTHPQLYSRLGFGHVSRIQADDVARMLDAWDISDDAERRLAAEIARRPGHFRMLANTMVAAGLLASGLGEPRGYKHIKTAYERLTSLRTDDEGAA
jgi:DNA transposition AAA+ family ATPase